MLKLLLMLEHELSRVKLEENKAFDLNDQEKLYEAFKNWDTVFNQILITQQDIILN